MRALGCFAQGRYLVSVSDDKSVRVWDLASKREAKCIENAHERFVTTVGRSHRIHF